MHLHVFHLPSVTSTNDYAKELLATFDHVMVSAEHQSAGRGRNGNAWYGEQHKNIYCSFGIRHITQPHIEDIPLYMACGATAVLDTLRAIAPKLELRLKYPNDIHVRSSDGWRKISGILVEHEFVGSVCVSTVIGIGINIEQTVFPDTISQPCTSLRIEGYDVDVKTALDTLQQSMSSSLMLTSQELSSRWLRELNPTNTRFRVRGLDGVWRITSIQTDGRLLIEDISTHNERIISDGDTLRYED